MTKPMTITTMTTTMTTTTTTTTTSIAIDRMVVEMRWKEGKSHKIGHHHRFTSSLFPLQCMTERSNVCWEYIIDNDDDDDDDDDDVDVVDNVIIDAYIVYFIR
ncbi:hypothetical protein LOAG_11108 [Loa loa]|uniref:Uncharacterized protein n=1 Tax=Loa loa TaxID=7209 RepID=A0A1S0TP44_LOALO|nr:hypothetical protein LOAG_11108 [Loa loa]EFO17390.1 hypothetical protein LOAG_11108 [Loa loa]